MNEFLILKTPMEAKETFLNAIPKGKRSIETVNTLDSIGRILAKDIKAEHPLPEFSRSAMDGYAVNSRDTYGASDTQPCYLSLLGEILMGKEPEISISRGTCALIHTGGMIPDGADAVVILEQAQIIKSPSNSTSFAAGEALIGNAEVEIYRAVANGENIIHAGEDVRKGDIVINAGTYLRPAEIGGCMAIGVTKLQVVTPPKVGILSCGDEVISPDQSTTLGKVRDVNSYTMASLVRKSGGDPILYGIIPDEIKIMQEVATSALRECDIVLITAGSSASSRDTTSTVISSLGKPGILVHGINIRPGKPTILAVCNGKPVLGLPGNPVSALVIAQLFLIPVLERIMGSNDQGPRASIFARLKVNIPSQTGREDWIPVRVMKEIDFLKPVNATTYSAEPIFSKSNLIFSLVRASGILRIPPESAGIESGEIVEVIIF